MATFNDIAAQLGVDMSDPHLALARDLAEADHQLLEDLVSARIASGMLKVDVAAAMGRDRSVVTNFEKLTADPHLSTIRRYAAAIGARITHVVEPNALSELAAASTQTAVHIPTVEIEPRVPVSLDFVRSEAGVPPETAWSAEGDISVVAQWYDTGAA